MTAAHTFAEDRYSKMPYRRCGRSGLLLPALSLGFWKTLGEAGNEELCRRCAYYAFDHGVTHFDLADNYGPPNGQAELSVGRILRDMPRDELVVGTKAGFTAWPGPYGDWGSRKHLIAGLDQSLRRLGLDYVDIFYHHRADPDTPLEESLAALEQIVRSGKALYIGVSKYSPDQLQQAARLLARRDGPPVAALQARINLMEREPKTALGPLAHDLGIGVIAFSPLAQGLLTDKYLHGLPEQARMSRRGAAWYEKLKAGGVWEMVGRLNDLARQRGQELAQMALTWLLNDPRITSVIVGASSLEQLAQTLQAAGAPALSGQELARIDEILSEPPKGRSTSP